MKSDERILFVTSNHPEIKGFVKLLAEGLPEWKIKITGYRASTLLFALKKFEIIHFFLPPGNHSPLWLGRKSRNLRILQTITSCPVEPGQYKRSVFGDRVIVFSDSERQQLLSYIPSAFVEVVPPCIRLEPADQLKGPAEIRKEYDAQSNLLVIALNDFNDHQHFSAFLYTAREYQRRGGFRFVIPAYRQDKQTVGWRSKLQQIVQQEKLTLTTLLEDKKDIHSLIRSADLALYIERTRPEFGLSPYVEEALCAGTPVISYNVPPVNEVIGNLQKQWLANTNEDFSRISRDLLKENAQLEQMSTDVARYAKSVFSVENVAAKYRQLYNTILSK
jgi:glycosyltransferase involved in cell wall biosynthesis